MFARSATTTAQTDTALVAAPGANRQIVVYSVWASASAADTVSLESGNSNLRWRAYLAANGVANSRGRFELFRCAPNEALTLTTSATSNTFVSVEYEIVRSTGT